MFLHLIFDFYDFLTSEKNNIKEINKYVLPVDASKKDMTIRINSITSILNEKDENQKNTINNIKIALDNVS